YYAPPTLVRDETTIEEETQEPGFYYTDAISDEAVRSIEASEETDEPLFLYVAYTAPHWPLHAPAEDIARYTGRYDEGGDRLREHRVSRQQELGILPELSALRPRARGEAAWVETRDKAWQALR